MKFVSSSKKKGFKKKALSFYTVLWNDNGLTIIGKFPTVKRFDEWCI